MHVRRLHLVVVLVLVIDMHKYVKYDLLTRDEFRIQLLSTYPPARRPLWPLRAGGRIPTSNFFSQVNHDTFPQKGIKQPIDEADQAGLLENIPGQESMIKINRQ